MQIRLIDAGHARAAKMYIQNRTQYVYICTLVVLGSYISDPEPFDHFEISELSMVTRVLSWRNRPKRFITVARMIWDLGSRRRRRESDVSWSLGADCFFSLFSMSEYRGVLLLANFDPPFVISVFGFHFLQMICLFGGSGPAPLVTCNVGHILVWPRSD